MYKHVLDLNKRLLFYHIYITFFFHIGIIMALCDSLLGSIPIVLFILFIHTLPYIFNSVKLSIKDYLILECLLLVELIVMIVLLLVFIYVFSFLCELVG